MLSDGDTTPHATTTLVATIKDGQTTTRSHAPVLSQQFSTYLLCHKDTHFVVASETHLLHHQTFLLYIFKTNLHVHSGILCFKNAVLLDILS